MSAHGRVESIQISRGGIPKWPVGEIEVAVDGLIGDAHEHECHRTPRQAVSLIHQDRIHELCQEGFDIHPGAMGENLTTSGISLEELPLGSRLTFCGGLILEVTKIRRPCFVLDAIHPRLKEAAIGRVGVYARVVVPGFLVTGELMTLQRSVPVAR